MFNKIFSDIEEIDGYKINKEKLSTHASQIQQNLAYENATYIIISNKIQALCNECNLTGEALAGYKYQMSTYEDVLNGLCTANELDNYDINKLKNILDTNLADHPILDGSEILANLHAAEKALEEDSQTLDGYSTEFNNTPWYNIFRLSYLSELITEYTKRVSEDQEDIDTFKALAQLFISVSNSLNPLFCDGDAFRNVITKGIDELKTNFDEDSNTYLVGDSTWKQPINQMLTDAVLNDDSSVNPDLIAQILSKDADAISTTEYQIVAYAYECLDVEQLDDFYMLLEVPEDVDTAKWMSHYNNDYMSTAQMGTDREFTIDSVKIDKMCQQLDKLQNNYLAIIEYGNSNGNALTPDEINLLKTERNNILQKITLAKTISSINEFYGSKDKNVFSFTENPTSGEIKLDYQQFVPGTNDFPSITLENHSVTVSATLNEETLNTEAITKLENSALRTLTNYSSTIVAQNANDIITSELTNKIFETIENGAETTGKTITKTATFFMYGLDMCEDLIQNEQNQAYIQSSFDKLKIGNLADYYDCVGNIVQYDNNTVDVVIYNGENTSKIQNAIRENLGDEIASTDITSNPIDSFSSLYDYLYDGDTLNQANADRLSNIINDAVK